jgi:hypothetical protein
LVKKISSLYVFDYTFDFSTVQQSQKISYLIFRYESSLLDVELIEMTQEGIDVSSLRRFYHLSFDCDVPWALESNCVDTSDSLVSVITKY